MVPARRRTSSFFQECTQLRGYCLSEQMNWLRGPLRSSDLSCLDFFLRLQVKVAYETPMASPENLVARISLVLADVHDKTGIFQGVRDSMHCRCEACTAPASRSFEHKVSFSLYSCSKSLLYSPFLRNKHPLETYLFLSDTTMYCEGCLFLKGLSPIIVWTTIVATPCVR